MNLEEQKELSAAVENINDEELAYIKIMWTDPKNTNKMLIEYQNTSPAHFYCAHFECLRKAINWANEEDPEG